jgi:hypothetical protein
VISSMSTSSAPMPGRPWLDSVIDGSSAVVPS